ncbi:MAG: hypothetical protein JWO08_1836 [Verrucomicrobiaceae bacterium]|nr:hypothetical protein [Verrucomicrobiaceae bacterium]
MDSLAKDVALISSIAAVPAILDVVCRTTGMGFSAIARVTEDRWVACSVLDNIHFGLKAGGELKLETTICNEIRQMRKAVVIDHVDTDELYRDHPTPRMYGFQSYISMPIFLASGEFYGTLCAIDPNPGRVNTPEITGMFKLFAELLSFHIGAAERLADLESHLLRERETAELREQFIGVLGHDLRSPLNAVAMGATLLREDGMNDEQLLTLDTIDRSVVRMSDLINDAMDFTRGRLGGGISLETRADRPLLPVLLRVIEEVRITQPDRVIETDFALLERVNFDAKRMAQLFTNLLSNAMTHGRRGTPVRIRAVSAEGTFELSVSNSADPIPPLVLERLFEPFERGKAGDSREGLGLGLYIASQIARSHGGELSVFSVPAETRFTFTMPTLGVEE